MKLTKIRIKSIIKKTIGFQIHCKLIFTVKRSSRSIIYQVRLQTLKFYLSRYLI